MMVILVVVAVIVVGGGALVIGGGIVYGDWGVLALVLDFREVILTSPPELAHCALCLVKALVGQNCTQLLSC